MAGSVHVKAHTRRKPMKEAPYTVYDKSNNPIGSVRASSKKQAMKIAGGSYKGAADATRVTSWAVKRSKSRI